LPGYRFFFRFPLVDGFFGFLAFVFALRFATMGCLLG
jgi:hypothetical protein